eukprot:CAMPEP_0170481080 /NCGR_PEP_ID=MMETSP0208-20121228/1653_1 /TAXON_ID=197538 /ORGANISM="Strombidium inclinatum, Strain S3" /LENGTH=129 /DNA_ID=CAMNT_0010753719 /DNA_START=245 /DNA_END=634 /DNA_ORIENTATION=-
MVNGEERDELLEVDHLLVCDLNGGLQVQYRALLLGLRLEQRFHSSLTDGQLVQFLLIVFLLLLGVELGLHDAFSALEAVVHALHVQELALQPQVGVAVGVLYLAASLLNLILELRARRMSEDSLVVILV